MTAIFRVAIVGAAGLKGKELKEVLEERNFPAVDVKLLDDDESLGRLESVAQEATFIQSVQAEQFENQDFTFFACDESFTRKHWRQARDAGSAVVDLSYALENESGIPVRSPWVERELGGERVADLASDSAVVAHPAATVLGLLLLRAAKLGLIERAIATVFEPVSERGQRGMDELHEQTINLLSFQQLPKTIFDAQVAFNMLSQYGSAAGTPLAAVEARILRHFRQITRGEAPLPSLMLLHSPVFHAHIFSVYIELGREAHLDEIAQKLSGNHVQLGETGDEPLSNANVAGEADVLVSIKPDAQRKNAFWLWAAADNLKLAALSAVNCAADLALTRSQGSVQ